MVGAAAATARAGNISSFALSQAVEIGDTSYNVYDMMVTCDYDWTNSRLDLSLSQGSLYHDAFGSFTEPSPAYYSFAPTLRWDTYLAVPGGHPNVASLFGRVAMEADRLGASWFNTDVTNIGTFKIAQLTLSADAVGSLWGTTYDAGTAGVGVEYSAEILDGDVVPEPATLGLLLAGASAGGAVPRRRKR